MQSKRIAIIGGGPIGIEAAIYGKALGHDVTLYERSEIATNVQAWGFVQMFTPWKMNTSPLGLKIVTRSDKWSGPLAETCPTGEDFRHRYLIPLSKCGLMRNVLREHTAVASITREEYHKADAVGSHERGSSPFRLLTSHVSGKETIEKADVIIDCCGTYGRHRWAGRGGMPALGERGLERRIWYTIPDALKRDRTRFGNRHVFLVGCGFSAATMVSFMQELYRIFPRTQLSWSVRRQGPALSPIIDDPLEGRNKLIRNAINLAERPPTWMTFYADSIVEAIEPNREAMDVTIRYKGQDLTLDVDEVVALVGYTPETHMYEQLQIHQCYSTFAPIKLSAALQGEGSTDFLTAGTTLGPETLKNPEPNYYILGAKSYGTNSNFLLQVGFRQIRDVFQLIDGPPYRDLYMDHSEPVL